MSNISIKISFTKKHTSTAQKSILDFYPNNYPLSTIESFLKKNKDMFVQKTDAGSENQPVYFSNGVPVAANVSTNYLKQGTDTLILDGGGAA